MICTNCCHIILQRYDIMKGTGSLFLLLSVKKGSDLIISYETDINQLISTAAAVQRNYSSSSSSIQVDIYIWYVECLPIK